MCPLYFKFLNCFSLPDWQKGVGIFLKQMRVQFPQFEFNTNDAHRYEFLHMHVLCLLSWTCVLVNHAF